MTPSPLVSVVLPCFQAGRFVEEAARSILEQKLRELELIAIDDGSTDGTRAILERVAREDARVRVFANDRNLGLIATLNRGIAEARGEFLARMDADDLSLPGRLERQVEVLRAHPELGVVGGGVDLIDPSGRVVGRRPVRCVEPEGASFLARFATPLAHVTATGRTAVFRAHPYRATPGTLHCEDYDLWTRMLRAGIRLANLDETLARVRVHRSSVSRTFETTQIENFVRLAGEHLRAMGPPAFADGALRVLVSRVDRTVRARDLGEGLAGLAALEESARGGRGVPAHPGGAGAPAAEIARIADEQRLDILLQSALRASPGARVSALARLVAWGPRFAFGPARSYLVRKLVGGREARLVR